MHFRLHPVKKILHIPLVPLMTGSSPLWPTIEEMLKSIPVPQKPFELIVRSTAQFLGQIEQVSIFRFSDGDGCFGKALSFALIYNSF